MTDSTLSVLPIALGANWVYALPSSEGLLLVDAGPDYPGAWEELSAQLDVHGYRPEQVRTVVVTHSHIDHSGLAARWQAVGAEVCGSRVEAERFELGFEVDWYDAGLVLRFLDDCGVPGERMARLRERWPPSREAVAQAIANPPANLPSTRWPGMLRATPFRPERSLEEGDEVRVGERTLRYVPTPGHTPGDSVYYEAATGALFSGDHLLPRITSNPGIHFRNGRYEERMRSLPEMARSLGRVRALRAGRLYPGHGEATVDVEGAAARTAKHHRQRQRKIVRLLRDGPLTPYEVLAKFFPHLPDTRLRQAMAEVMGQIDALVEAGAVAEERVPDGALRIGRVEGGRVEGGRGEGRGVSG